ncbi:MAG TPA: hypothetical protein VM598_01715 [Bdellovibrionota bacterium]|nr:hypothetical protein [Bdellovibrionota bacterium]
MGEKIVLLLCTLALVACSDRSSSVRRLPQTGDDAASPEVLNGGKRFLIGRKAIQLLPFKHRLSKLRAVVGTDDPAIYDKVIESRFELGEFDHANGINQELSWLETRMSTWLKALEPVCASGTFLSRYAWPDGARRLLVAAYGRQPTEEERLVIDTVQNATGSDTQRMQILCLSVLSSLEFLTL